MFDVKKKILIVNMLILCMFSLFKVDVYASEEINKHLSLITHLDVYKRQKQTLCGRFVD